MKYLMRLIYNEAVSDLDNCSTCEIFKCLKNSIELIRSHAIQVAGAGLIGFTGLYLAKIWYSYGTFKRMGIATPDYTFFYGHCKEMLEKALFEWTRRYGKIYGIFEGHLPILVISDPEMVQEIFIKQFSNFSARRHFPFSFEDDDPRLSLFFTSKGRWKRQRSVLNPAFSSSRLKEVFELVKSCSKRLVDFLYENDIEDNPALSYLRPYTMEIIWNCLFGIDIDCLKNPQNVFVRKCVSLFDDRSNSRWNLVLATYFFEFRKLIIKTSFWLTVLFEKFTDCRTLNDPSSWLNRNVGQVLQMRFSFNVKRTDFVNILLESYSQKLNKENDTKPSKDFESVQLEKKMTGQEIESNLLGFLLAGFDTMSLTLTYCLYEMAKHSEEMRKLQAEVDSHCDKGEIKYESIDKLEYMDLFIKEVLRFYPLASYVIARRCAAPCTVKGIRIPQDMIVAVDCKTLHFDPDHWGSDAQEFNPSRFSSENKRHPAVYLPFGIGPRKCVGMRFGLLEIKLTLAHLLSKYDILATKETPNELRFNEASGIMMPTTPIKVAIVHRD